MNKTFFKGSMYDDQMADYQVDSLILKSKELDQARCDFR